MTWALALACGMASIPAALRWLRVAQREHYLPPSTSRFAWRWWTTGWKNVALLSVGVVGLLGVIGSVWFGFLVALVQIGPIGLSLRGSTSSLAWTQRMRRLATVTGLVVLGVYFVGAISKAPLVVVLGLFLLPLVVDVSLLILAPIERRLGSKWVAKAGSKLAAMDVEVVAITGSYGKTTTKNYLAHLLEGSRRTVASPASFNNRMGLARAINENLTPGTEVFVAEMGTYSPGEIADLCRWNPPKVAAIVAIGPVHLERFGSEERIVEAKSEILDGAEIGVLCVDNPLLADLSARRRESMRVVEVSGSQGWVLVDGVRIAAVPSEAFAANLAVAIGVALALGVSAEEFLPRISDLPVAQHRQSTTRSDAGFTIIDDTFNSHPAGARRALEKLEQIDGGAKVVVTPGMVELGRIQTEANRAFASQASEVADHLIIVGQTNRSALLQGSVKRTASVTVVNSREDAVSWVRANLKPGDVVLYENDLPDHYP